MAPALGDGGVGGDGERGYTLVALAVAVVVLSILTAAALPVWTTVVQREREEELIARGWQYAEAIRVFQQRHGRYPVRLEELIEVEPRSIRRLWDDPITEGDWALVLATQRPTTGAGGRPGQPQSGVGGDPRRVRPEVDADGRPLPPGQRTGGQPGAPALPGGPGARPGGPVGPDGQPTGPIIGVRSKSTETSFKTLFGEESYDKWLFTADLLAQGPRPPGAGPQGNPATGAGGFGRQAATVVGPQRAAWIGRPFPEGIQPELLPGQAPGGQELGGPTGPGGRPPTAIGPDGRPRQPPTPRPGGRNGS